MLASVNGVAAMIAQGADDRHVNGGERQRRGVEKARQVLDAFFAALEVLHHDANPEHTRLDLFKLWVASEEMRHDVQAPDVLIALE